MKGWPIKPLGELCNVVAGGTPSRARADFYNGGIPWVKISDMLQGTVTATEETISQLGLENSAAKILPAGTVLISIFATIGRTAILGVDATTNQAIAGVTPKNECDLSQTFLRYFLDFSVAKLVADARGVAQLNINGKILKSLCVPVPPLAEQKRIVKLLDEADELRKLRAKADRRTAELIPALFHEMFGRSSGKRTVWPNESLGKLVTFVGGGTPSRSRPEFFEGKIPWATSKDMKGEYISDSQEHITEDAIANSATNLVPAGSVLVVVKSKILMHSLPVLIATTPICFGQDLKALVCGEKVLPEFIASSLRVYKDKILAQARGANTEGLTLEILRSVEIALPPASLQKEFAARVSEIRAMQSEQSQSRRRLDDLFQSMLHRAFTGELTSADSIQETPVEISSAPAKTSRPNRHFARAILSAEIVHRLHNEPTFGRIKHQKIFHLCEHIARIEEIEGAYSTTPA